MITPLSNHKLIPENIDHISAQVGGQFGCYTRSKHLLFGLLELFFGAEAGFSYFANSQKFFAINYGITFLIVIGLHAYDSQYGNIEKILATFQKAIEDVSKPIEDLRTIVHEVHDIEQGLHETLEIAAHIHEEANLHLSSLEEQKKLEIELMSAIDKNLKRLTKT